MRKTALLISALAGSVLAADQAPPLLQCTKIADAVQRLACYDRIMLAGQQSQPAASASVGQPTSFGLPQKAKETAVLEVESAVADDFQGWGPNEKIQLRNGQLWEVIDGSSGVVGANNRLVRIRRGALGSYYFEFEGLNKSPRVRRIQKQRCRGPRGR